MGKKIPEIKVVPLVVPQSAKPLHAPVIKVSCGIGDTDGFPAFDVDSDAFATPNDPKWGFQITGGSEFHMPITVFQVSEDGLAAKGGVCLGDIILEINGVDAKDLKLAQAHDLINKSTKKLAMLAKGMDDEGIPPELRGQDKFINLRMPKPAPPKLSIEQRLREMQRKLSEIAEIPKILSTTLETVSQTFDKIVKPSEDEDEVENDTCSEIDSLDSLDYDDESDEPSENDPEEEETPESDYVSDPSEEVSNYCYTFRLNWCNVPEVKIDPTPEEKERAEKQEKLSKVEKSWPWADREKIIYKQSSCHLLDKPMGLVKNRIEQLKEQHMVAFGEQQKSRE